MCLFLICVIILGVGVIFCKGFMVVFELNFVGNFNCNVGNFFVEDGCLMIVIVYLM